MKKSINLIYNTKYSFSLKLDFDINVLRNCKPPYEGNSFDEVKKYLLRYVFGGDDGSILGHVTVDYKWLEENESVLKSCDLGNGHTLYDELDLDGTIYRDCVNNDGDYIHEGKNETTLDINTPNHNTGIEYQHYNGKKGLGFVTMDWSESSSLEEPLLDERPGFEPGFFSKPKSAKW